MTTFSPFSADITSGGGVGLGVSLSRTRWQVRFRSPAHRYSASFQGAPSGVCACAVAAFSTSAATSSRKPKAVTSRAHVVREDLDLCFVPASLANRVHIRRDERHIAQVTPPGTWGAKAICVVVGKYGICDARPLVCAIPIERGRGGGAGGARAPASAICAAAAGWLPASGASEASRGLLRVPCACTAGVGLTGRVCAALMSGSPVMRGLAGSARARVAGSRHVHLPPQISQV
eukprot:CAMPEP_0118849228 /NCGR_PEP_ID=MMETSP1162-20130426/93861_1 /TAXON_ID=33656 /ORGANISM="Phaeocystis Sp, Strain CCMP2710" /LENGTH=232 /DNA_ID=CAMNT_0006781419 /DNA_START=943 /DNA_END=1643 /DNA_ORIENTATION=-